MGRCDAPQRTNKGPVPLTDASPIIWAAGRGSGPERRTSVQKRGPCPHPTTLPQSWVVGWGRGPERRASAQKERPMPPPNHLAYHLGGWVGARAGTMHFRAKMQARFPSRTPPPQSGWPGGGAGRCDALPCKMRPWAGATRLSAQRQARALAQPPCHNPGWLGGGAGRCDALPCKKPPRFHHAGKVRGRFWASMTPARVRAAKSICTELSRSPSHSQLMRTASTGIRLSMTEARAAVRREIPAL